MRLPQEAIESGQRLRKSPAVHQHQHRVPLAIRWVEDASGPRIRDATAPQQLHQFGQEFDRTHRVPPFLQHQGVAPRPGSQVEHASGAQFEGPTLERREGQLLPKEPIGRQRIGVTEVVDDEDDGVRVTAFVGEEHPRERIPGGPDPGLVPWVPLDSRHVHPHAFHVACAPRRGVPFRLRQRTLRLHPFEEPPWNPTVPSAIHPPNGSGSAAI